jgi:hypothetical protein
MRAVANIVPRRNYHSPRGDEKGRLDSRSASFRRKLLPSCVPMHRIRIMAHHPWGALADTPDLPGPLGFAHA